MVTSYGFSDTLGDVDLNSNYARLSSETKQQIEGEVRRIIEESRQRATKLLMTRRKELEIIANALVEYEVLDLHEMQQILRGEKLEKMRSGVGIPMKLPEMKLPPHVAGMGESDAKSGSEAEAPGTRGEDGVRI